MSEFKELFNIFSLDQELEAFKKIENDYESLSEVLNSHSVYLIIDPKDKIVWIWNGAKANVRMKFIATQKAPLIRDEYGIDYKIIGIDQDNEPSDFKTFLELKSR